MTKQIPARALDEFDRAILRIIQQDNKTPQRQIAERVNLSAAAVQRRIAAMEESRVITRNVAIVDPDAIQPTTTVVVEVKMQHDRSRMVDETKQLFQNTPEIQHCYYVTGGAGFILVMHVPDMRSYEQLSRRLFADNDNVQTFRTLVVLDSVKVDTAIPIP